MRDTWLASWLKDWAIWRENPDAGFGGATVIYRHTMNQIQGGNVASLPVDVTPPKHLEKLVHAMHTASNNPKNTRYIAAMQMQYLFGVKGAAEELKKPLSSLRRWVRRGEEILRLELKK